MTEYFIKYVERRLEEWADWYGHDHSALGYPTRTMEYLFMTEGILVKTSKVNLMPSNEEAEEIEALVSQMERQNKKMAQALRIQYFGKRKARDNSHELKLSASRFKIYVDMAKQWLAGRLSNAK